jgi:hypothetical protein
VALHAAAAPAGPPQTMMGEHRIATEERSQGLNQMFFALQKHAGEDHCQRIRVD